MVDGKSFEGRKFLVLHVKIPGFSPLIDSFPTTYFWSCCCAEEKLHFIPVHTLRQLKCDEGLFPPLRRVVEFRARYAQRTARRFWGQAKFGERATHGRRKIVLHTSSDLSKPVRTCPNLSEPVHNTVTMYARRAMSFFCTFECSYSSVLRPILPNIHILTCLIESFPIVYGL